MLKLYSNAARSHLTVSSMRKLLGAISIKHLVDTKQA